MSPILIAIFAVIIVTIILAISLSWKAIADSSSGIEQAKEALEGEMIPEARAKLEKLVKNLDGIRIASILLIVASLGYGAILGATAMSD